MRTIYSSRVAASVLVLSALVLTAACAGSKDAAPATTPPAREIQLAPTTATSAPLNDAPVPAATRPAAVAKTPAKATPKKQTTTPPPLPVVVSPITQPPSAAPAPAPAPAAPRMGTVAEGVTLTVHPSARVCTNTVKAGDRVTTTLAQSVQGSNGLMIPAGSEVTLGVTISARGENSKDAKLAFDVMSVRVGTESYDVGGSVAITTPLEKVRVQSTGDQAKKVGAGAVIGAIAGQIIGKNTKSTVIGGAVGAAAGAAVASGTSDYNGCVPTTGDIAVTLTRPLTARVP